jgi:hypothetical protein
MIRICKFSVYFQKLAANPLQISQRVGILFTKGNHNRGPFGILPENTH